MRTIVLTLVCMAALYFIQSMILSKDRYQRLSSGQTVIPLIPFPRHVAGLVS